MKKHRIDGRDLILCVAILSAGLSGCRDSSDTPLMVADKSFAISEVRISNAAVGDIHARVAPITTADPVVISVVTAGQARDADLSARLIFLASGKDVGMKHVELSQTTPSPITLRFEPAANRLPGRYLVEIKLSGKFAARQYLDISATNAASTAPASSSH